MPQLKPCIAVVSPFVDKRHGTERRIAEWLKRLVPAFEIHLYSQRVEDLDLSQIVWHKIPALPGPHLLNYLWWFAANHAWRAWDRRFRGLRPTLVFSPGINCLDADVISVHVVFAEYLSQNAPSLRFRNNSVFDWLRLLHRRAYYQLIAELERIVYRDPDVSLILVSRRTSRALKEFFGRKENFPVVYLGLDHEIFDPRIRMNLRDSARRELGLREEQIALLLIGNDWRNKGLPVLLEALASLRDLPVCLLVVGHDDPSPYRMHIHKNHLMDRVIFLPPRKDVEFYYAAADIYTGPSREDTFAQPPAEAMACGLAVITSVTNGTSEIITNELDGLLLPDPLNGEVLAAQIRRLCRDRALRERLGARAAKTANQFSWERNGEEMTELLLQVLRKKHTPEALAMHQEA
jgi:glycosyltransferase involved in cell wall biosynthesis